MTTNYSQEQLDSTSASFIALPKEIDGGSSIQLIDETLGVTHVAGIDLAAALNKEKAPTGLVFFKAADAQHIPHGTDVVFIQDGGTVDLSGLDSKIGKDLNALIFSTDEDVNIAVGKTFKGVLITDVGDDTVSYSGKANITVDGGAGNDLIQTGSGKDVIISNSGNDTVHAGGGNDKIIVGKSDDTQPRQISIDGGDGKDELDLQSVVLKTAKAQSDNRVLISLDDGSQLIVANVEKFVVDFNGDGSISKDETISLVGLLNLPFDG